MTTFTKFAVKELQNNGMFEQHAVDVVARAVAEMPEVENRWNENIEDYPAGLRIALWTGVRRVALDWIKENLPNAWYRPMFDDELAKQLEPEFEEWLVKKG